MGLLLSAFSPIALSALRRGSTTLGVVVGYSSFGPDVSQTFTWSGTTPTPLNFLPGGTSSLGLGINNSGVVAGFTSLNNSLISLGTIWTGTAPTALNNLPGSTASVVNGINNAGVGGLCRTQ